MSANESTGDFSPVDNGTVVAGKGGQPVIGIVQTGQPPEVVRQRHGDFPDWFARQLGVPSAQIRVYRVFADEALPAPGSAVFQRLAGVIVTGSPAMITEQLPWSARVEQWLRHVLPQNLPVLGVCYGHQLLAQAAGGRVDWNPHGRQIGQVRFQPTDSAATDPLFSPLLQSSHGPLSFYATHLQAVQQLPARSNRLGESPRDVNHAFRLGECAWGVQFHPEFSAEITRAFIDCRADAIAAEGQCPRRLRAAIDTCAEDCGRVLLRQFARLCLEPESLRQP